MIFSSGTEKEIVMKLVKKGLKVVGTIGFYSIGVFVVFCLFSMFVWLVNWVVPFGMGTADAIAETSLIKTIDLGSFIDVR